jgi:hypothetical protein
MSQLTYLMREIGAGVEIFYSSKSTGQFVKSAFVLCDNYTELISKLFLIEDDYNWSDTDETELRKFEDAKTRVDTAIRSDIVPNTDDVKKLVKGAGRDRFKNYHRVLQDVYEVFNDKRTTEVSIVDNLHTRMKARRDLRNDFFHSAKLLRLSIDRNDCIEAFCDLLDYGELLFQTSWRNTLSAGRTLGTLETLLRLELKSYGNPFLISKVNEILEDCPQYLPFNNKSISTTRKGIQISKYPADLHLILTIIGGGQELKDKLSALLL